MKPNIDYKNDNENNNEDNKRKLFTESALVDKIKHELALVIINIQKYKEEIKRLREVRPNHQNYYDFSLDVDFSINLYNIEEDNRKYCYRAYKYQKISLAKPTPVFKVSLQDLSLDILRALFELESEERKYVIKQAVGRIFEDINSKLYHDSISSILKVKLIDGSDYDYVYTEKKYNYASEESDLERKNIISLLLEQQEEQVDNVNESKEKEIGNIIDIKDEDHKQEILEKTELGDIVDFSKNISSNGKQKKNKRQKQDKEDGNNFKERKREFTSYKYSQIGRGDLYEAVLINDFPQFISFNSITKKIQVIDKIEEKNRIIKPPQKEEYPYTPYEFESEKEIYRYIDYIYSNRINIDYLYNKSKSIISKFNSQEDYKLNLIAADVILSYFQDRFSTTHYNYFVGGNGSGKSSLADTFGAIGYRVVIMTDPTAPNLFRLLGVVEPAQCTIILEEAERIDKSEDLLAVLKTGSSFNGRVPRINTITNKQEFFFSFGLKIIVSERSLNQSIAKGVNDRTFPHKCIKGDPKHDIKEVLNPTDTGGPEKNKLLKELIDFQKLLLIYRLIHFKDPIPDLDIGIVGRDKELAKPLIQLFHNSEAQNEIIKNLQKILDLKNQKKQDTLEAALLPIVVNLISEHGKQFLSSIFWSSLKENISGNQDEKKPNEYHTEDYGTIFRTTITNTLKDIFGVETKHTKKGSMLIFDPKVVSKLTMQYNTTITLNVDKIFQSDKSAIDNNKKETQNEQDKIFDKIDTINFAKSDKVTRVTAYREGGKEEVNGETKEVIEENTSRIITHMPSHLSPGHPSQEIKNEELKQSPSSISLTNNSVKNKQCIDEFDLVELRSFISSSSFYRDILSVLEKEKDPQIRKLIIHNAKNIKRSSDHSDKFVCSVPCRYSDDKWGMLKHPCKNFYK